MTLVWYHWGWLVPIPSIAAPCKVEGGKGRLVLSCCLPSHPFAFLLSSFPLTPMLPAEKLELAAWILARVEGPETLVAVRSLGSCTSGGAFLWMPPTAFHGASGPGCGTLVSLFGNYTQDGGSSMDLGVSRRERSCPLVLQTHKDMRGRKRGRRRHNMGMLQSSLPRPVSRRSGASAYEQRVASPL